MHISDVVEDIKITQVLQKRCKTAQQTFRRGLQWC